MLDELVRILVPPESPIDTGSAGDWRRIQQEIGTAIPNDYCSFIERYGSGGIDGWLYFFNPFAASKYTNLQRQISARLGALREIRREFPRYVPFPVYPEKGGVLPWGCTGNGDTLYWVTTGKPSDWSVCINEGRGPDWDVFAESMTGFLIRLLKRQIRVRIFPDDLSLGPNSRFTPA
jgi:hypothetical protein